MVQVAEEFVIMNAIIWASVDSEKDKYREWIHAREDNI